MTATAKKWIRTAADEYAVSQGCWFDERAAVKVCAFFPQFLRHSKGDFAGKPFEFQAWQRDEVMYPLFGWKNPDGTRRFRIAYIELPKKNGKSTWAAGIGLYMLAGDGERGAEVYSAATKQEQASIVHDEAIRMVDKSPPLARLLKVNRSTKNIAYLDTESYYRALSSEAHGSEGLNAHCIIVDELHAWPGTAFWDSLKFAGAARSQPLRFVITTAGNDQLSICWQQHEYARQVIDGTVQDTRFFGYIRCAEASADWKDPAVWRHANPSLGVAIKESDFAADVAEAEKTPSTQSSFKRYRLNVWDTQTSPWMEVAEWNACADPFEPETLEGMDCQAGLDLAKTRDTTSLQLVFRRDDEYKVLSYFWLPEDTANSPDSPPEYRQWARDGWLLTTKGNVCDYRFIKAFIGELSRKFNITELAYDPWNAEQLTQELEDEFAIPRVKFPQTITNFTGPMKELERLILDRKLSHPNHPVMRWQFGNVSTKSDPSGNIRPVKPERAEKRKIDGIVALIMALGRSTLAEGESIYNSQGFSSIGGDDE